MQPYSSNSVASASFATIPFLLAGRQTVTDAASNKPTEITVDEASASKLAAQFNLMSAAGNWPQFDIKGGDQGAIFWASTFRWSESPSPGVYCDGHFSDSGRDEIAAARSFNFRPVVHVENGRVCCCETAKPLMGSFTDETDAHHANLSIQARHGGDGDALLCRAAFTVPVTASGVFMWMPAGLQTVTPFAGANGLPVRVLVDAAGAAEAEKQRRALAAKGMATYFDFEHKDDGASFWVSEFFWAESPEPGIYARGEWTVDGKSGVEGKKWRYFSPVFHVDNKRGNPARLVARDFAAPNMGGLVNNPAFKDISPLWAKQGDEAVLPASQSRNATQTNSTMLTTTDIAREVDRALAARLGGSIQVTAEAPKAILAAYGALVAKNATTPLRMDTMKEKNDLARNAALIFESDIARNPVIMSMPIEEALKAADYSDPNLSIGLLSGTLVMQQTLPLFLSNNPILSSIATDFSAEPGQLYQTENTRIILKPPVQTYDPTPGPDGRPLGWKQASPAQSVDVSVTLDEYVGIPIVFSAATMAQTTRRLFDEFGPMALDALADYVIGKLSALMTPANFNAYKGTSLAGGATTSGSKSITFTSSTNVYPGQAISGTGLPDGTYIASVESGTAATLTQKATATGSSLTFTLSAGKVPTTYTTYAKALASWAVADLDALAGAFDSNGVPMSGRFAALNPQYYRKLGSDSAVNALMQATGDARFLTERRMPMMSNFELINSPWMPGGSNQTGFAGHKASLVLKTRLPNDISTALPGVAMPGRSATVTDPKSGLSMLLVQYGDPKANFGEWRPEIMLGAAVGDRRGGLVITSA